MLHEFYTNVTCITKTLSSTRRFFKSCNHRVSLQNRIIQTQFLCFLLSEMVSIIIKEIIISTDTLRIKYNSPKRKRELFLSIVFFFIFHVSLRSSQGATGLSAINKATDTSELDERNGPTYVRCSTLQEIKDANTQS